MKKYNECEVVGIEVLRGTRKSDGKPYQIVKLHCNYTLPYDGSDRYTGEGVVTATCTMDELNKDDIALGSIIQCVEAVENGYRNVQYIGIK